MGWWRINCLDNNWDDPIPKKDHHENHYNGDDPTDVIQKLVDEIEKIFIDFKIVATKAFLLKLIKYSHPPSKLSQQDKSKILKKIKMTWKIIDKQYFEAWNRPSYSEERHAIVDLVLTGWEK